MYKMQWEVSWKSSFPVRSAVFSGMENQSCVNAASTWEEDAPAQCQSRGAEHEQICSGVQGGSIHQSQP